MMLDSSSAVLAFPSLHDEVWPAWQAQGGTKGPAGVSTITSTGRVADIITLAIENSLAVENLEASKFYIVTSKVRPTANKGMIDLLRRWIHDYGDEEDPDLNQQLADLRRHRLVFREKC